MANIVEYTLSLNDQMSSKLRKIGVNSAESQVIFTKLKKQSEEASNVMNKMGVSVGSLQRKLELLRAERDWIPEKNITDIRRYNSEIKKLEKQVNRLQTINGSKLKTWTKDAFNSLPGIATNPLVMIGAGVGAVVRKGMEADMQKANILTLVRGNSEKAKKLFQDITDYGIKTPYEKSDLVEGQKTMISFGVSADKSFSVLKNIGDIALGDANKMKSLALAFGQATSAGKLQGQDLLQMINAGFNPLQVISEKTGETMVSLKDRMSKGAVSADEMAKAFKWATEEGGLFYQGAERASQTFGGRMSNLMDALSEMALSVYEIIGPVLEPLVIGATKVFSVVGLGLKWVVGSFKDANPVVMSLTAAMGALLIVTKAQAMWSGIIAIKTAIWTGFQWLLNLSLWANPIGLIVAGVAALITAIVTVAAKTEGWGKTWGNITSYISATFSRLIDRIMIQVNKLKAGWIGFKESLGIGDSEANKKALADIAKDTERRQKEIGIAGDKQFENIWQVKWKKDKEGEALGETNTMLSGAMKPDSIVNSKSEAVASGGTRNSTINITLGNMVGEVVFNGTIEEKKQDFIRAVEDALARVLFAAQSVG